MPKRWLRGATTRCRLSSKQDLLNTVAPCSLPGCPVVSVSPSHAHPTEKKKVQRGPHLCPAAFLCVLSMPHAACQQKGQVKSVPGGAALCQCRGPSALRDPDGPGGLSLASGVLGTTQPHGAQTSPQLSSKQGGCGMGLYLQVLGWRWHRPGAHTSVLGNTGNSWVTQRQMQRNLSFISWITSSQRGCLTQSAHFAAAFPCHLELFSLKRAKPARESAVTPAVTPSSLSPKGTCQLQALWFPGSGHELQQNASFTQQSQNAAPALRREHGVVKLQRGEQGFLSPKGPELLGAVPEGPQDTSQW